MADVDAVGDGRCGAAQDQPDEVVAQAFNGQAGSCLNAFFRLGAFFFVQEGGLAGEGPVREGAACCQNSVAGLSGGGVRTYTNDHVHGCVGGYFWVCRGHF